MARLSLMHSLLRRPWPKLETVPFVVVPVHCGNDIRIDWYQQADAGLHYIQNRRYSNVQVCLGFCFVLSTKSRASIRAKFVQLALFLLFVDAKASKMLFSFANLTNQTDHDLKLCFNLEDEDISLFEKDAAIYHHFCKTAAWPKVCSYIFLSNKSGLMANFERFPLYSRTNMIEQTWMLWFISICSSNMAFFSSHKPIGQARACCVCVFAIGLTDWPCDK